jgi:hypothetical protein
MAQSTTASGNTFFICYIKWIFGIYSARNDLAQTIPNAFFAKTPTKIRKKF